MDRFDSPNNQLLLIAREVSRDVEKEQLRKSNVCILCAAEFTTRAILKAHLKQLHNQNNYTCTNCGKSFSTYGNLYIHMTSVHSESRISCSACDDTFTRKSSMEDHYKNFHLNMRIKCHYCEFEAGLKANLRIHMKKAHKKEISMSLKKTSLERKIDRNVINAVQTLQNIATLNVKLSSNEESRIKHENEDC